MHVGNLERQLAQINSCPQKCEPHRFIAPRVKAIGEKWCYGRKTEPCLTLNTGDFPNHSPLSFTLSLSLSSHEAPLSLFKQNLIRLVDFISCRETDRKGGQPLRERKRGKGRTKQPCHHCLICLNQQTRSLHSLTHPHTHTFALRVHYVESLSMQTRACLSFCFSKGKWQRWRPRQTQSEITRHAPNILSNLMAAVLCPVLTRIWAPILSTISYQDMNYCPLVEACGEFSSQRVRVSDLGSKRYLKPIGQFSISWNMLFL